MRSGIETRNALTGSLSQAGMVPDGRARHSHSRRLGQTALALP